MRSIIVGALALAGCGRISFDARGDATTDSAAATDSPPTFCGGATTACPVGSVFCDDYETSSGTSFPRWSSVQLTNWQLGGAAYPNTAVTGDGAPCRGSRAAHVHTEREAQLAFMAVNLATRPNPIYVRTWMRVASTSSSRDFEILGFHDASGSVLLHIQSIPAQQVMAINAAPFTTTAQGVQGPAAFDVDRWMCLETRILFDSGTAGEIQVWLDGASSIDLQNVTTEAVGMPMTRFVTGVVSNATETGNFDIDYDDTVVSDRRIGCN